MPAATRQPPIILNGNEYPVVRVGSPGQRARWFHEETAPSSPDDLLPFEEVASFGYLGMGGSLPSVREQYDYSLDIDVSEWDEMGPGALWTKVGLAFDAPIVALETGSDANGDHYLYAGGGAQMAKLRLVTLAGGAPFTNVGTVTFTGGTPSISDIIRLKAGSVLSGEARGAYSSDAYMLIGFGASRALAQIDVVGADAADTYRAAPANSAYASYFAFAPSTDNTQWLVYQATGVTSGTPPTGAFAAIQASTVVTSPTKDYTLASSWTSVFTTRLLLGDPGTPINALLMQDRGPLGVKPEGLWQLDTQYGGFSPFGTVPYADPENGKSAIVWGNRVVWPTVDDLKAWPVAGRRASIGLRSPNLVSNLSPVTGRPWGLGSYGDHLFAAYYDGTDSYLVKIRIVDGERVPGPVVVYPQTKLTGHKSRVVLATSDGASDGKVYLVVGCASATANKYDVQYAILDPVSARRYAASGTHYCTRMGSYGKRTIIEEISGGCVSCASGAEYQEAIAWDEGSFTNIGNPIQGANAADGTDNTGGTTGRWFRRPTAGTADSGYFYQLRSTLTNSTSTNRPRLRGASSTAEGGGGFVVKGQRQADAVRMVSFRVRLGQTETGDGGHIIETVQEQKAALLALVSAGPSTFVWEEITDDRLEHTWTVLKVAFTEQEQDGNEPAVWVADIQCKIPLNFT